MLNYKRNRTENKDRANNLKVVSKLVKLQANFDFSKLWGLFSQCRITRSANSFALRVSRTYKKIPTNMIRFEKA